MTVYVELDDEQKVIGFHLRDAENRIPIDDNKHAELFEKQMKGFDIFYNDGDFTFAEKEQTPSEPSPAIKIMILKQKLSDTDYQAIKYAEGRMTEEEYAPIAEQRQSWRDEINRLQG